MCDKCKTPIYVKVKQYYKPLLAPLTIEQELRDRLIDMTGEVYVKVTTRYCPFCGEKIACESEEDDGR